MSLGASRPLRVSLRLFCTTAAAAILFCFSSRLSADEASNWAVSTFAGQAQSAGTTDGIAGAAHFNGPRGVAVDASGQIFIADTFNHTIRKISPGGAVTTWAGAAGTPGSADGAGGSARFNSPAGLAIDSSGTLYVADMLNHTIRKISADGTVSTLAGSAGTPGTANGSGSNARFQEPVGVAVDSSGNVFVADSGNSAIRKITPGGVVTTYAGNPGDPGRTDGSTTDARFDGPYGVAVDNSGAVYVADTFNHAIRRISNGSVSTWAGQTGQSGSSDGFGASAQFSGPSGIAVDSSGSVYVTETANNLVRVISSATLVSTVAGSAGNDGSTDGSGIDARFSAPYGIAVGPASTIYVSDTVNNTVRKLTRIAATPPSSSPVPDDGTTKIINISTRSYVGTGGDIMIAGFVIGGTEPKQVLIRASGPALSPFGVTGVLQDPVLELYAGQTQIAQNDDWGSDAANIQAAATRVNAFAWPSGSKDAAIVVTLPPGAYTAHVLGKNDTTGVALIEVYEADQVSTNARLINISTRSDVRVDSEIMIAGFIVSGNTPKRVLIRASGPALADFGLTGVLADPVLSINTAQGEIAQNDDWGTNQSDIEAAVAQTGAFAWKRGSKDAAIVLTLAPGGYTALVKGKNNTTGMALIEVFEAP